MPDEIGAQNELAMIPLSQIRDNPVALRTVNRTSEDYLGLVESIRQVGVLNAITVRKRVDPETKVEYYELVDGLQRTSASRDAGKTVIPAQVTTFDQDKLLEAQVIANLHRVETRPHEFAQQLKRILVRNPMMTQNDLAVKISVSPTWIQNRLGLLRVTNKEIQDLINDGKIKLANAYALAKLPNEEMGEFVQMAMTLPPDEFVPKIDARAKEIRDAKRQGKEAVEAAFTPIAHCRKMSELRAEAGLIEGVEAGTVAKKIVKDLGIKNPVDAFICGVQWTLQMDPKSIEVQKAEHDQRVKEREAAKKRLAAERAAKKAADQEKKAKEAADAEAKIMASLSPEEQKALKTKLAATAPAAPAPAAPAPAAK